MAGTVLGLGIDLAALSKIPFQDKNGYDRYMDPWALELPYLAVACLLLPFWLGRVQKYS